MPSAHALRTPACTVRAACPRSPFGGVAVAGGYPGGYQYVRRANVTIKPSTSRYAAPGAARCPVTGARLARAHSHAPRRSCAGVRASARTSTRTRREGGHAAPRPRPTSPRPQSRASPPLCRRACTQTTRRACLGAGWQTHRRALTGPPSSTRAPADAGFFVGPARVGSLVGEFIGCGDAGVVGASRCAFFGCVHVSRMRLDCVFWRAGFEMGRLYD